MSYCKIAYNLTEPGHDFTGMYEMNLLGHVNVQKHMSLLKVL